MKKITLNDGTEIIEKKEKVCGIAAFGYYINGQHAFGVLEPFSKEKLQALYDGGYFDFWR